VSRVLTFLPDLHSLQTATSSCPVLHHAYTGAKLRTITRLVLNHIDPEVRPEAVIAHESYKPFEPADARLSDFAAKHLGQRSYTEPIWDLNSARRMESLHFAVNAFSQQFATSTLAKLEADWGGAESTSIGLPQPSELHRFQRALYRFETYWNLFRPEWKPGLAHDESQSPFFGYFSHWENEQLACINDLLCRSISPVYNDFARYDIAWGANFVYYPVDEHADELQCILSLGLVTLRRILYAETPNEIRQLLDLPYGPHLSYPNLRGGLKDPTWDTANALGKSVRLYEFPNEEERAWVRPPFFHDPDPGPAAIWRWAHWGDSTETWVCAIDQGYLRYAGYVMWNWSRLDGMGIFKREADDVRVRDQSFPTAPDMHQSHEARLNIYEMGGRGWWKSKDDNNITWPVKRSSVISL
jgi:hypothetical protein